MPYDALLRGRHSQAGHAYFVTTVLADRKQRCLEDFVSARIVIGEMRRLNDEQAVTSLAFVVMPDHVHWLFQLGDSLQLAELVKRFKARSAQRVNVPLCRRGALWQPNYYDRAVRADEDLRKIARYMVGNPFRAGLASEAGSYPHWDAAWL
ncbi:MAG: transposase [Luteimonas sp.]